MHDAQKEAASKTQMGSTSTSQLNLQIPGETDLSLQKPTKSQLGYAKKLPSPDPIYVVDFFCGCGGMSYGFANTRQSHRAFNILLGIDIDANALKTYETNVDAPSLCDDIRTIAKTPQKLENAIGSNLEKLRPLVFVGCPPCQGFSAHRRKDERDDPRNNLSIAFAEICGFFKPDVIVIENVKEILCGRFASYFTKARQRLERHGYRINADILDFSHYGVPQKRHRAVVIGSYRRTIELPRAILDDQSTVTVRQAIGHLNPISSGESDPEDPHHRAPKHIDRILELIRKIPKDGGDRRHLDQSEQLKCHNRVDKSETPGFTDVYGRLRWDIPSVTITAKSSTPSCGRFLHPEQDRNISVREAALLQGFPHSFDFKGPFANQYRQIGEAVPPKFARALAWAVLDHFSPKTKPLGFRRRKKPEMEKRIHTDTRLHFIDAFSGAGGLSLGFEEAGFINTLAFDLDSEAIGTFRNNLGEPAEVLDIQTSDTAERVAEVVENKKWIIVGGPPCQGFSQQRRGDNIDPRNNLVTRYIEFCLESPSLPEAIVLENVTYLDSPRGREILTDAVFRLNRSGFKVFRHDLNSADYGVPQLMRRIIIVALTNTIADFYSGPPTLSNRRWPTVGESIEGLPRATAINGHGILNHTPTAERTDNRRRIAFVDMGKGRLSIPTSLQLPCHRKYGGHLDVYGRLDWYSQARTITGGFDSFTRGEYGHPIENRSITAREAARIQGFPDWFEFTGTRSSVRRQIGNAVPPPMAYCIAKGILNAIEAR